MIRTVEVWCQIIKIDTPEHAPSKTQAATTRTPQNYSSIPRRGIMTNFNLIDADPLTDAEDVADG